MSRELTEKLLKVFVDTGDMHMSYRDLAAISAKEIERLLAAEREPMECGHPKACLVPEHFFEAMKPCNKPYDVYVCEICGQNMHKHTDGGGTAWIMKEYCSACDEREKVRGMCVEFLERYHGSLHEHQSVDAPLERSIVYESPKDVANKIRQLDLTKDEGSQEKLDG